ncbi:MAG: mechanosensitive ion channel [Verrucomicrobia bacterium]|nr:mechanosensitive ion channel [Verrucomicrobiota bacterium]
MAEVLPFSDWPLDVEIAAVAVGIYLLTLGLGRLFKARSGLRLGAVFHLFCLTFGPWLALTILAPDFSARRHLGAACIFFGALALVRPINRFLWHGYFETRRKATVPKFVREISAGLLMLATTLFVIGVIYDLPVAGLVAGSSVIGIVLGFAMQDTLGNVIAGLALQFGRPFELGDWVLFEGRHAQVVELNWRSTRFCTNDLVQLDVPNLHVVRAPVVNYHAHQRRCHAMRFEIGIEYDVPPNRVKELLARAAANGEHVLREPAPNVFLKSFGESAVNYEVRYWLADHRLYNQANDSVQTHIWYALRRAGIRIPFPIRTLHVERTGGRADGANGAQHSRDERRVAAGELLRAQPIFQGLANEQLQTVVDHANLHQYGRGEPIIREGTDGSSMFVLIRGEAGVTIGATKDSAPTRVATLRRGDCFGEMSLLTGEPRRASVLAASDCEVLEITKTVFAEIIVSDPSLLPRLSDLLARRQMETEGILQARAADDAALAGEKAEEYRAGFLSKLRSFFEV